MSYSKLFAIAFTVAIAVRADGHFPWMALDDDGKAIYFFGETLADRAYKMPSAISEAEIKLIHNKRQDPVEVTRVDTEDLIAIRSNKPIPRGAIVSAECTYGVYHSTLLHYHSQFVDRLPKDGNVDQQLEKHPQFYAELVRGNGGVEARIVWQEKPLVDATVRLYCADGHEEGSEKTDPDGRVFFTDQQVEDGLNGIVVGFTLENESGKLGEQAYTSESHYLTATFVSESAAKKVSVDSDRFPVIPEPVTSFGAAILNDVLYVYGGHMGDAHQYYVGAQANMLRRLDLKNPKQWEDLGSGPDLQGLAMVSDGRKLYRIGGFTAKNKQGEENSLWSQSSVSCFDPKTEKWSDIPPLPEPRSSFDAVVTDGKLFVIGGWSMQGDADPVWHKTAHVLELSETPLQWKSLPEPPFQRRALSVGAVDGKVYAIGGMRPSGKPTTRVDVFDIQKQTWSRGPDLDGERMDGFGSSSFAVGKSLYVTTYGGNLLRLEKDSWEKLAQLENERFFHRLLPLGDNELLSVGGASMSSGKFEELDVIKLH